MFPHPPLLTSQCIYMVIDCGYVVVMVMCKVLLNSSICSFSLSHSSCLPRYNASTSGICLASVLQLDVCLAVCFFFCSESSSLVLAAGGGEMNVKLMLN